MALFQVPDLGTAFEFREDVYKMVGIPLPKTPSRKVLLWFRQKHTGNGRYVINTDQITALMNSYDIEYT